MSRSGGGDDQIETIPMSVRAIKAWLRACGSSAKKLRSDENPLSFFAVEMTGQQGGWRAGNRRRRPGRQAQLAASRVKKDRQCLTMVVDSACWWGGNVRSLSLSIVLETDRHVRGGHADPVETDGTASDRYFRPSPIASPRLLQLEILPKLSHPNVYCEDCVSGLPVQV